MFFARVYCRSTRWFLIGVALLSVTVLPWTVHAIEYGGFGGRPANPRSDNPRTESIFVHTVVPGATIEDAVLVVNNSSEEKTLVVYAADSTPSTGGAFACKQFSEPKISVGAWVSLAKSELTLSPGTNEVVSFSITVPENAGVGEHNGCILIQEKKERSEEQTGAVLSVRTGLRVAVTVPGDIVRKLEIVGFSLTPELDKNVVLLHPLVKNTGNVSIDASARVVTKYFFGIVHAEHGGQYPILRGETSDWNFELERPFWGGWYKSSFVVDYDENPEAVVGVNSGKNLTRLEGPTYWFFVGPTLLGLAIEITVVFLLLASMFLVLLSRKRRRWIDKTWVEYRVVAGDDLNTLAQRYGVSWKLVAKVNKLQPPYALKPGDTVQLPPKMQE